MTVAVQWTGLMVVASWTTVWGPGSWPAAHTAVGSGHLILRFGQKRLIVVVWISVQTIPGAVEMLRGVGAPGVMVGSGMVVTPAVGEVQVLQPVQVWTAVDVTVQPLVRGVGVTALDGYSLSPSEHSFVGAPHLYIGQTPPLVAVTVARPEHDDVASRCAIGTAGGVHFISGSVTVTVGVG